VQTVSAALGLRLHTGWAAAVTLTGWTSTPRVVDRRHFALVESPEHDAKFVYHAAAELDGAAAARVVAAALDAARRRAHLELEQLLSELSGAGYSVSAVGLPPPKSIPPARLSDILRSHALIHSAEGELFRAAMLDACETEKLHVVGVSSKEGYQRAARAMGVRLDKVKTLLSELGRPLGPPWALAQKEAALAALLAGLDAVPR
jgi:hypothetical protein